MFKIVRSKSVIPVFANSLDAFVPEIWAQESLLVLYRNLVMARLVHRDFEDLVAQHGDVVNTRQPAKFTSVRKAVGSDVTDQNANATNVAVPLDQHHHVSYIIRDGEESKGIGSLIETYSEPALRAIAQAIDESVLGQRFEFLANQVGQLGTDLTVDTLVDSTTKLDDNLCPIDRRNCILTPSSEGALLKIDAFTSADKVGDDGSALREGSLGRKYGLNLFATQNNRKITAASADLTSGAINLTAGYSAGDTSIAVDGFSAAIVNGTWFTVAGDMTPQVVTSTTGAGTPTEITFSPGLVSAVVNNAVVTTYDPALVNLSAGYAAGFTEKMAYDGSVTPQVGQLMTIGTTYTQAGLAKYGVLAGKTSTFLTPSRNLDATAANNAVIGLGPSGNYNFAFDPNAIALVSRPLAPPKAGAGALSAVAVMDNLAIRVTIAYDSAKQGHRVTTDLLCGVKTLDTDLGVLLLG